MSYIKKNCPACHKTIRPAYKKTEIESDYTLHQWVCPACLYVIKQYRQKQIKLSL